MREHLLIDGIRGSENHLAIDAIISIKRLVMFFMVRTRNIGRYRAHISHFKAVHCLASLLLIPMDEKMKS